MADADARQAFIHTVRTVVDVSGQRANATDRLYLAAGLPTLIIWGAVPAGRAGGAPLPKGGSFDAASAVSQ